MSLFSKFKLVFLGILIIYLAAPIIFRHSVFIQRNLLFMNYVNTMYNLNLSQPELLGLKCTRTLRLTNTINTSQQEPIELGVWHILPKSRLPSCVTTHNDNRTFVDDTSSFDDGRPIVFYVHGNGGSRGGRHRAGLYFRLAYEFDFHIITFDYRGYGDSSYVNPTAGGLLSDTRTVFDWLLKQPKVTKDRINIWGHSLGTAVATRLVSELPPQLQPPKLILEAPFDTLANAIANHPFAAPFKIIPYFEYFFIEPIQKSKELNFNSVQAIKTIKNTQVMILHAEDDGIIPLHLGLNLYTQAVQELGKAKVQFVRVKEKYHLGHKYICQHDEAMKKAKQFIG